MISIIDLGAEETDFLVNTVEELREKFTLTTDESEIIKSDKIILPASGDAADALRRLHLLNLFTIMRICRKPLLGICLGMHLMAESTAEGNLSLLGIFPLRAEEFKSPKNKNPFKGMHSISVKKTDPLYKGIPDGEIFYFCNSYFIPVSNYTTAIADNNQKLSASIQKDNFFGIQFSPEKSGEAGKKVIRNFIEFSANE